MNCVNTFQESSQENSHILGLEIKNLISHGDERGYFREIIRVTDSFFSPTGFAQCCFAQWSHSKMIKNTVKAWHYHHIQYDWWYVPLGVVEAVMYDNREESPTYKNKLVINMGDFQHGKEHSEDIRCNAGLVREVCIKIPPGVLHGCKVLTSFAHLMYITSAVYNPKDEGRFPYNAQFVGHEWGSDVITVENDRREFRPEGERERVVG